MANGYVLGNLSQVSVAFTDDANVPADPTTVICIIVEPDGTKTTYTYGTGDEVVRDGVGEYHLDLLIDAAGSWPYRWAGTGAVIAADEGVLQGLPSMVL